MSQEEKARIVTVASSAHAFGKIELEDLHYNSSRRAYTPWGAYGQSKLANVLFAKGLAMKLKKDGFADKVTSLSLHPGVIRTNLWRYTPINFGPFGALSNLIGFIDKTIPQVRVRVHGRAQALELTKKPQLFRVHILPIAVHVPHRTRKLKTLTSRRSLWI